MEILLLLLLLLSFCNLKTIFQMLALFFNFLPAFLKDYKMPLAEVICTAQD